MPRAPKPGLEEQVAAIIDLYRVDPIGGWGEALQLAEARKAHQLWPLCERLVASADPAERYVGFTLVHGGGDGSSTRERALRMAALNDSDHAIVDDALGYVDDADIPWALPTLERLARTGTGPIRREAVSVLARAPSVCEGVLTDIAADRDVTVRRLAVAALATGVTSDSAALRELLLEASRDPDHEVRGHALSGLAVRADDRAAGLIAKELAGTHCGLALEAAELCADAALLPALDHLDDGPQRLDVDHLTFPEAARAACDGTFWALRPRSRRLRRQPTEPLSEAERAALVARNPSAASTCIWLNDPDRPRIWLVDLATLEWRSYRLPEAIVRGYSWPHAAGQAVCARWGGMVAIYRIGSEHRMIVGRHRFDLRRPAEIRDRCHSVYSALTVEQDGVPASARRWELLYLLESIGLGDPMITTGEPFGGWYSLQRIARLARLLTDHTAGPYDYRRDLSRLVRPRSAT